VSNPVDVVREFCALMERRDPDALRPLLADNAVYQNVGMPAFTGVDAIVENLGAQFSMFPDAYAFEIVNIANDRFSRAHRTPRLHPDPRWSQASHSGDGNFRGWR
jgi:limonene-1,2-epoxide hydrolase